jgi:bifunctional polynucleotide phosphatase/kinase
MEWKKTTEYYEGTTSNFKIGKKIASFDLDDTLIKTKSKKKFATGPSDWDWLYENIPKKIKELYDDDFTIIIISNQAGIGDGKKEGDDWIEKVNQIVKELNIEMKVFCSISKNKYRKPIPTFREEFFPEKLSKKSFFCGDAVGRKGDFADTDYKFALNCDIKFYTPEHLFLGQENELPEINYCIDLKENNKDNNKDNNKNNKEDNNLLNFESKNKEMIIMVGYQGSGKSYFSNQIKEKYGYVVINQDTLKTKSKCIKEAEKQINNKKSIIIDSTNPSKEKRKEWIDLAKQNDYNVRVIHMQTSIEQSKHNNIYRSLTSDIEQIPEIAYNMYKSKYEKPELEEDIDEIIEQKQILPDRETNKKYYTYLY